MRVFTCKRCGCDNAVGSTVCNGCGGKLEGIFSSYKYERWICPNCSRANMTKNNTCLCGAKKPKTLGEQIFIGIMIFIFGFPFLMGLIQELFS